MPTGKGAGRRDARGSNPCAGQHQAIAFALPRPTATSFKSSKAAESPAPAGAQTGSRLLPGGCSASRGVGSGAAGRHWELLGGGTAARRCPVQAVPRCCWQLTDPRAAPSPPRGTRHGLQPSLPPKSRGVTGSPCLQQRFSPLASHGAPGIGKKAAQLKRPPGPRQGMHPCPSLGGTRSSEIGSGASLPVLF